MSALWLVLSSIGVTLTVGFTCPEAQTNDTHLVCLIFKNTNLDTIITDPQLSVIDNDYCSWSVFGGSDNNIRAQIGCNGTRADSITEITLQDDYGLNGSLNFAHPWPNQLEELDLEQLENNDNRNLHGEWDWESLQPLTSLTNFEIQNNKFSGAVNWTIVEGLQSLWEFGISNNMFHGSLPSNLRLPPTIELFYIGHNNFNGDFPWNTFWSVIELFELDLASNNFTNTVKWDVFGNWSNTVFVDLSNNSFHGTIDVTSFYIGLEHLLLSDNQFNGSIHWDTFNRNVFTALENIQLANNNLIGEISMSDNGKLPTSLTSFDVQNNMFSHNLQWNIFEDLYELQTLNLNDNDFSGQIDWTLISDLYKNGKLQTITLQNNLFIGDADFTWITGDIWLELDADIPCNANLYDVHCPEWFTQGSRNSTICTSKAGCESTCQCGPTDTTQSPSVSTNQPTIAGNPTTRLTAIPNNTTESLQTLYLIIIILLVLLICTICLALFCWMRYRGKSTNSETNARKTDGTIEISAPNRNQSFAQRNGLKLNHMPVYSNEGFNDIGTEEQPGSPFQFHQDDKDITIPDIDQQPGSPRIADEENENENENENEKRRVKYSFNSEADNEVIGGMETPIDSEIIDRMETPIGDDNGQNI